MRRGASYLILGILGVIGGLWVGRTDRLHQADARPRHFVESSATPAQPDRPLGIRSSRNEESWQIGGRLGFYAAVNANGRAILAEEGIAPPTIDSFLGETRDPTWAPAMESTLVEGLVPDLRSITPEAGIEAECRARTCLVTVTAPADRLDHVMDYLSFEPIAPLRVPLHSKSSESRRVFLASFGTSTHSPRAYQAWAERTKRGKIELLRRAGHSTLPSGVPFPDGY